MGCSQKYIKPENHLMELVNDLSNEERCDEAYKKISKLGKEMIPFLLENSTSEEEYKSSIYHLRSSLLIAKPQVGVVSLYLIESILEKRLRPYKLPLIINEKDKFPYNNSGNLFPTTRKEYIKEETEYYHKWWEKVKDLNLEEIRKTSPLENTELRWY